MQSIMKKITIKLLSIFAVVLLLNGCSEADPILYSGPTFVSFTDGVVGDYFVQEDNTPYPITVGIPAPAGNDVTVNLNVLFASGTAGTHYDVPSSVTIPSGSVTADFNVTGYFANMSGRKDTLVIEMVSADTASFNTVYTLYLQQFCPFVLDDFVGAWTAYEQSDYETDPYPPYTVNFALVPGEANTLVTTDIWPYFPIKVVFSASDPANFNWIIPDQFLVDDLGGYGEGRATGLAPGAFSACDMTASIRYKIYVSAGNFEQATLQLVKD
jgi:hypothetical protein